MQKYRLYLIPLFLIAILVFLQYRLWMQPGGMLDMFYLNKQVALGKQENDKLRKRNDALLQQVQRIQKNKDAVESRARQDLGMIKKGEVFYQVVQ